MAVATPEREQSFRVLIDLDPLAKAVAESTHARPVQGLASTDDVDQLGEVIHQPGMDWQAETIDWDHHVTRRGEIHKYIGECDSHEMRQLDAGRSGWFIKGHLYPCDNPDKPYPQAPHTVCHTADWAWAMLEKQASGEHQQRFGFSVEGGILRRVGAQILKSVVRRVALTNTPVNTCTYAELARGQIPDPYPLAPDQQWLWTPDGLPCPRGCHDTMGRFGANPRLARATAMRHLALCKGLDPDDAKAVLLRIAQSGLV